MKNTKVKNKLLKLNQNRETLDTVERERERERAYSKREIKNRMGRS